MEERVSIVSNDVEEFTEEEIITEFAKLYQNDPELRTLLGENPDSYTLEEKCSIIQAYKKGGGVAGLADIIDDDEDNENFGT